MKKVFLLTLMFTLTVVVSIAQHKGYIAISGGASVPTGDFASKDPENSSAGFAKTGGVIDISFGYKLSKNYGIAAMFRGQANKIDEQVISNEIKKQLPEMQDNIESDSWKIGGLMVGGYSTFPVSKKLTFESKILFGFLSAKSPSIKVDITGNEGSFWMKQNSVNATAFSYLIGASFNYDAGSRVSLFLNLDYLGARPEFRNVEMTSNFGYNDEGTYRQSFGTVNFSVGAGYRL